MLVNASAGEVIFTGSATESDNTALNAALGDLAKRCKRPPQGTAEKPPLFYPEDSSDLAAGEDHAGNAQGERMGGVERKVGRVDEFEATADFVERVGFEVEENFLIEGQIPESGDVGHDVGERLGRGEGRRGTVAEDKLGLFVGAGHGLVALLEAGARERVD